MDDWSTPYRAVVRQAAEDNDPPVSWRFGLSAIRDILYHADEDEVVCVSIDGYRADTTLLGLLVKPDVIQELAVLETASGRTISVPRE